MYKMRFAPVSGARSSALGLAAGYFFLNGVVLGLFWIVGLIGLVVGKLGPFQPIMIVGMAISAMVAGGMIKTGQLIGNSKLFGGYLGMFFVLAPPILKFAQGIRIDSLEWVFTVIGVGVMASIWHELE